MIERVWIGKEEEGENIGRETMFVESTLLLDADIASMRRLLASNKVECLYFGAGKKSVEKFGSKFFAWLKEVDIPKVIEIKSEELQNFKDTERVFSQVVVRKEVMEIDERVRYKLDDTSKVRIFTEYVDTDITNVKDGMYEQDIILLKDDNIFTI